MNQESDLMDPSDAKLTRVFSRTPSSWDPQDDVLLRHLKEQQKLGWKEIASYFNNRTPNACQFRWRRLRSGALKSQSPSSPVSPPAGSSPMPKRTLQDLPEKPQNYVTKFQAVTQDHQQSHQTQTNNHSQSQQIQQPQYNHQIQNSQQQSLLHDSQVSQNSQGKSGYSSFHSNNSVSVPSYNQWTFHNQNPASMSQPNKLPPSSHMNGSGISASMLATSTVIDEQLTKQLSFLAQETLQQVQNQHHHIEALAPANHNIPWNEDEDELLSHRRERELSFAELSILLPTRSESDIWSRIDWLEKKSSGPESVSGSTADLKPATASVLSSSSVTGGRRSLSISSIASSNSSSNEKNGAN